MSKEIRYKCDYCRKDKKSFELTNIKINPSDISYSIFINHDDYHIDNQFKEYEFHICNICFDVIYNKLIHHRAKYLQSLKSND